MKLRKKLIIYPSLLLGLAYASALVWLAYINDTSKMAVPAVPEAAIRSNEAISIATIFTASDFPARLEIPSSWEGRYTIEDGRDSAILYYRSRGSEQHPLLIFYKFEKGRAVPPGANIIVSQGNFILAYKLEELSFQDERQQKLTNFKESIPYVIQKAKFDKSK